MRKFTLKISLILTGVLLGLVLVTTPFLAMAHDTWSLLFVFACFMICFFIMMMLIMRHFSKPIMDAISVIEQFQAGHYKVQTYRHEPASIGVIGDRLNALGQQLQREDQAYHIQQEQMKTLIENINSSLLLIDMEGKILLVNDNFQSFFGIEQQSVNGQMYEAIIDHQALQDMIKTAILKEEVAHDTLMFTVGIERKFMDVYCSPVKQAFEPAKSMVVVLHDITKLKKLEKVRKDFVANVSHELKTPVTSLKGFAETLTEEELDQAEKEQFLSIIKKESVRLQSLIHDLLELSKIEDDHFRLHTEQVDIAEIIDHVVTLLKDEANKKNIHLQADVKEVTIIIGESHRMKQIFLNMIQNAIHYSPPGAHIFVHSYVSSDWVYATIRDEGIGIREEEIPRVFERFYRVDQARSRASGGTGLGLAIVKHLVEAHQGTIEVESALNEGTTFKLAFPRTMSVQQQ